MIDTVRNLLVQVWPIARLVPYARNSRTHTDEQVAQVAASIVEFGWANPILVGPDGVIIAGHARLAAARKLKMAEVPVIVLDHLTPTQRRALILADNRLALSAGWDEEMLRVELESLEEDGFDLDLVGFTEDEIEELLRDPEETREGLTDEDAVPEEQEKVITVPGDLWLLGEHRLRCGDATQMGDVEKVLAGCLADMVFTDPPYNVDYQGKTAKKLNAGGHWSTFVIWAKHHFTLGRSDYQRQYAPILYGCPHGIYAPKSAPHRALPRPPRRPPVRAPWRHVWPPAAVR